MATEFRVSTLLTGHVRSRHGLARQRAGNIFGLNKKVGGSQTSH